MSFRRVVTGHSSTGRSVFLRDDHVSSLDRDDGSIVDLLWALDGEAVVPNDGSIDEIETWDPAPGGIRVFTWVQPPVGPSLRTETSTVETSPTIDVIRVLSGQLSLELDGGVVMQLGAGDVVVQNGVRPRWENRSDQVATLFCMTVGAQSL